MMIVSPFMPILLLEMQVFHLIGMQICVVKIVTRLIAVRTVHVISSSDDPVIKSSLVD